MSNANYSIRITSCVLLQYNIMKSYSLLKADFLPLKEFAPIRPRYVAVIPGVTSEARIRWAETVLIANIVYYKQEINRTEAYISLYI